MPNEVIFAVTVLLYLGSVLLLYKLFGKNGLYTFAIFGTGRAYDQVRNGICYPNLNVKLGMSHAGVTPL